MSEQLPNGELEKFLNLAMRSGLLQSAGLAGAFERFQRQPNLLAKSDSIVGGFCEFLTQEGILTRWQCDKLREGRYKGFFLDNLKLLRHVGCVGQCAMYEADDTLQKRRVVLRVYPPTVVPRKDGKPHYEIVDEKESRGE